MYTKAIRADINCGYSMLKSAMASVFRFQYPNDYTKPITRVKFPGPNHLKALETSGATCSKVSTIIVPHTFKGESEVCQFKIIKRKLLY